MNRLLPFEEKIVDDLSQLHMPQMEDAIWSRIDGMLKADDMFDESDSHKEINTKGFVLSNKIKVALFIFITAFFVSVILIRNKKIEKQKSLPAIHLNTELENNEKLQFGNSKKSITKEVIKNDRQTSEDYRKLVLDSLDLNILVLDSSTVNQLIPDSNSLNSKISVPIKKDSSSKKLKGVKGIFDSDYRFRIEKKDSLKIE